MITLPDPSEIRRQIDLRKAEIVELRELLRLAQLRQVRRYAGLDEEPSDLPDVQK